MIVEPRQDIAVHLPNPTHGQRMRVLLMGMPDVASSFDRVMKIPNLAIVSLAANLEGCDVVTLDLALRSKDVGQAVREQIEQFRPDVVGLSAMTFQYPTACEIARLARSIRPETAIVLGGYHATLAYEQIASDTEADAIDFIVRGEGEQTLNALIQALRSRYQPDYDGRRSTNIRGLSYRTKDGFAHNPPADLAELDTVKRPDRRSRAVCGFHYFGKPFDVVESSRGCPRRCRFCCIRKMYGDGYREYSLDRVIEDIREAREAGAKGVFFADDNINLRPERFSELCRAIVDCGLSDMEYVSQADIAGFLQKPELAAEMSRAGFSGVFLGIESVDTNNWRFLRKSNMWDSTKKVIEGLQSNGISVAGGFIVGNPEDDERSVRNAFHAARALPMDHAIMWCLTPYPGTEARDDLMAEGLVANPDRFDRYNGFICNVRTRHLKHGQLVRLIAWEGLKLYLSPTFALRAPAWRRSLKNAWTYYATVQEYLTKGYRNRLFESRHRM